MAKEDSKDVPSVFPASREEAVVRLVRMRVQKEAKGTAFRGLEEYAAFHVNFQIGTHYHLRRKLF